MSLDGQATANYATAGARVLELEKALQEARAELEQHVRERTPELPTANAGRAKQIARRQRAEEARTERRRRLVRAQEEEHRRIARELHDDLTQQLAVLAIEVGKLERMPACGAAVAERARGMRERL